MENSLPNLPVNPDPIIVPPLEENKKNHLILVVGIVAAILIVSGGIFGYFYLNQKNNPLSNQPIVPTPTLEPASPDQSISSDNSVLTVTPSPVETNGISASSGNTNTQLDQDTNTLDTNLNSLNTELSGIDQGLNDKQTNLSE
jgi:hypothetical protein